MSKKPFTGDETILDIMMELPESYEVFASYGLACAGCPIAPMEGLRDGAGAHGIEGKQFQELLEDLNEMKAERENNS